MRTVAAVLAIALLAGVLAIAMAVTPSATHDTSLDDARARVWLATTAPKGFPHCFGTPAPLAGVAVACYRDGHLDVDGDGRADCWRLTVHPADEDGKTQLALWPGCRGEPTVIAIWVEGMTKVAIPDSVVGTDPWLRFIASKLVDRLVLADVHLADPAWQWVLASATRRSTDRVGRDLDDIRSGAWDGQIAPSWQPLPVPAFTTSVLVIRDAPPRWLWHLGGGDLVEALHDQAVPAWLVFDAGTRGAAKAITCGAFEIRSERGGVIAVDKTQRRWAWLFRGLADFYSFAAKLTCVDGDIIADTGSSHAHVAVLDPRTGGWLFEPATDAGPGAWLWRSASGEYIWLRDANPALPFSALRAWLAEPATTRPTIASVVAATRPELTPEREHSIQPSTEPQELPNPLEPKPIPTAQLRGQIPYGTCDGWTLTASATAALATRGTQQRWIDIEDIQSPKRISAVRCEHGKPIITRGATGDLLDATPTTLHDELVIDLVHGTWTRAN